MRSILPLFLLIFASNAFAQNIYVSASGSDSNPGTQTAPFLTIQHAANVSQAGTTVHVATGTYNLNSALVLKTSGTSGNPITYVSDAQWGAHIVFTALIDACIQFSANYNTFTGFDVTESNSGGACRNTLLISGSTVGNLINHNRIHDITHNPAITGCTSSGATLIGSTVGSGHVTVDSNYLYNLGTNFTGSCVMDQGIYFNLPGTATNNVVFHVPAFAINVDSASILVNNTIFATGAGGIYFDNAHGTPSGIANNNIIFNWGTHEAISYINCSGSSCTFNNNLISPSSGAYQTNGTTQHFADVFLNPLFVNYTGDQTGNYQLIAGSPAIQTGTGSSAPATDFGGNTRPNPPSIGAYENNVISSRPDPPTGLTATVR